MEPTLNKAALYTQSPLPNGANHIRLLKLYAGHANNYIDCKLSCWSLLAAPEYRAISYTWGSPVLQSTIFVNGEPIAVRQNCHYALWQARSETEDYNIWIDSICINQSDLDEKAQQVAMMGDIYATATAVVACIGPADATSAAIQGSISEINGIARNIPVEWHNTPEQPYMSSTIDKHFRAWYRSKGAAHMRSLNENFELFCLRPYFQRLWIAQELHGGRNRVLMLCGATQLDWAALCLLEDVLYQWKGSIYYAARESIRRGVRLDSLSQDLVIGNGKRIDPTAEYVDNRKTWNRIMVRSVLTSIDRADAFPKLLEWTVDLQCQEARDRIYGTLRLVDWRACGLIPPVPSYTTSIWRIGIEMVKHAFEATHRVSTNDIHHIWKALRLRLDDPSAIAWNEIIQRAVGHESLQLSALPRWPLFVNFASIIHVDKDLRPHADFDYSDAAAAATLKLSPDGNGDLESKGLAKMIEGSTFAQDPGHIVAFTRDRPSAVIKGIPQEGDIIMGLADSESPYKIVVRPGGCGEALRVVGCALLVEGFSLQQFQPPCDCYNSSEEEAGLAVWTEIELHHETMLLLSSLTGPQISLADFMEIGGVCIGARVWDVSLEKAAASNLHPRDQGPLLKHYVERHLAMDPMATL